MHIAIKCISDFRSLEAVVKLLFDRGEIPLKITVDAPTYKDIHEHIEGPLVGMCTHCTNCNYHYQGCVIRISRILPD